MHVVKYKKLHITQYIFTRNAMYIHKSQNAEVFGSYYSKASDIKQLSERRYTENRELHKRKMLNKHPLNSFVSLKLLYYYFVKLVYG